MKNSLSNLFATALRKRVQEEAKKDKYHLVDKENRSFSNLPKKKSLINNDVTSEIKMIDIEDSPCKLCGKECKTCREAFELRKKQLEENARLYS